MSSEESQRQGRTGPAPKIIIGAIALVAIIVVLFFLFRGRTATTNTGGTDYADSSTLSCTANNIDNGVFAIDNADFTSYDFSIIFHNDSIYNLTYAFAGTYSDETTAIRSEAKLHASIGKFLQDRGTTLEAFSSNNFSINGNKVTFSITAAAAEITPQSAPALMLDVADADTSNPKIPTTLKEVEENYTKRGFVCKEQN